MLARHRVSQGDSFERRSPSGKRFEEFAMHNYLPVLQSMFVL
jgi:hypothetical protein